MKNSELFDLRRTLAAPYLSRFTYPWEALTGLSAFISYMGKTLSEREYTEVTPDVYIHRTARVAKTALIEPPAIIGAMTELRHGAYLRGAVLAGEHCVIGNSTEVKNAILFDRVQVPHFNYVGDSILGHRAHFGAGVITANVRLDHGAVTIHGDKTYATGRGKCGAMVGDFAEIGSGSVLCPGAIVGRSAMIYPLSTVRGAVPENAIWKNDGNILHKGG